MTIKCQLASEEKERERIFRERIKTTGNKSTVTFQDIDSQIIIMYLTCIREHQLKQLKTKQDINRFKINTILQMIVLDTVNHQNN